MSIIKRTLKQLSVPRSLIPLVLLWLCAGGIVLLLPYLGYYWDDWAIAWISNTFGTAGLERYFSTNRVYWGRIFQLSAWLVGRSEPWRWQLYALAWHWIGSLSAYIAFRKLLPKYAGAALWVSCLFAVYPGYSMQPLAIFTAHFYIVLTAYLLSLALMAMAQSGSPMWRTTCTLLALLLALINQVTTEYFFMLELLRPFLLWVLYLQTDEGQTFKVRMRRVVLSSLPYLLLFAGVIYWRVFIFSARPENFQSANYEMVFFTQLKEQPLAAILTLLGRMGHDLWLTTVSAWQQALTLPDPSVLGTRSTLIYALLVLSSALPVYLVVRQKQQQDEGANWGWLLLLLAAAALLLAGWPFWLTELPVGLGFPNSRFTLPFMLGASLLLAALLQLLPLKQTWKALLLSLLVGLAVGQSFRSANEYRRDWNMQRSLFWQMVWRMPQLEPGTTVLANDWPGRFYSDNSLTAPLNWVYAPYNDSEQMSYMFFFPAVRLGYGLPDMQGDLPIEQNYLAATFSGSTSNMVALYYGSDACLRVLDPDTDSMHWSVSPVMRQAAAVSNRDVISALPLQGEATLLPQQVFGEELPHGWCYYFEKAELAAQFGDWQQVVELGETAFGLSEHPNDPAERLVFIEGYAHQGEWQTAVEMTQQTAAITPLTQPMLCSLWQRLDENTPASEEKDEARQQINQLLSCK